MTVPPKRVMIPSLKIRYIAVRTTDAASVTVTEPPTLLLAFSGSFLPRLRLTNAQQPSPIITATARAITVSGKTTVFAALPNEPR